MHSIQSYQETASKEGKVFGWIENNVAFNLRKTVGLNFNRGIWRKGVTGILNSWNKEKDV